MSSLVQYQPPAATMGNAALVLGITSSLLVSGIQLGAIHTVPLLYTLPVDTSTQLFSRVHRGSAKTGAPLAALSATAFAISAYLLAGGQDHFNIALAHAAGLILSSLVWTRVAMKGVTRALLNTPNQVKLADEMDQAKMKYLLRKWKWMNLFKGGLTFGGGLIGLVVLVSRTT